jgi:hypothetical protein
MKRTEITANVEHRIVSLKQWALGVGRSALGVQWAAALALLALPGLSRAAVSADYAITPAALDGGGGRSASADYTVDASVGLIAGRATAAQGLDVARHGYIGQLTEPVGHALAATPQTVPEEGTRQLYAATLNDDDTRTALTGVAVAWSVVDGPIAGISAAGLATAGAVYQDTQATVRGQWDGADETLALTVHDTQPDNYGSYAADGLGDGWQIGYYGFDNPNAAPGYDPFGTGDNLFKYVAGLDPTDPESRLHLRIARSTDTTALEVEPIIAGRSYSILQTAAPGAGQWKVLTPSGVHDNGPVRTFLSETNAPSMFYRVRIQN